MTSDNLEPMDVQQRKEDVFVDSMDSLQEYLELHAQLQGVLKQGMFDIARAKYSMGAVQVSSEQYDMEMEASTKVISSSLPGDDTGFVSFALDTTLPVAQRSSDCIKQQQEEGGTANSTGSLRQASTASTSEAESSAATGDGRGQGARQQDPLAWFGVLVPPTLRSAQQSFCKVLALAVELSNRQQRCLQRCQQFEELCNAVPCSATEHSTAAAAAAAGSIAMDA